MNWNSEPPTNIDTVLVRLDDGRIKWAWWNYTFQRWNNVDECNPLEGTVTGWLSIDEYIQQTQALAQPGAFVGKWEKQKPDEYDFMDYVIFGDEEYYCNLSAALEVVERMMKP